MKFADIVGNENTKKLLINAKKSHHVAHAQMFLGGEGSAAYALAWAYAQFLNCSQPEETDSCGRCTSCLRYAKMMHPDLHFVFPTAQTTRYKLREEFIGLWREFMHTNSYPDLKSWANNLENKQLNISVAESRQIIKDLALKTFDAPYKVMLIWLPEFMQAAASNALLKILEEPPVGTLFFLVAARIEQLLPTIISRTQMIKVNPFTEEEIKQMLVSQGITETKAGQVALLSEGNYAAALRLVSETNDDSLKFFQRWMQACFRFDFQTISECSDIFSDMSKEIQKNTLHYSLHILRDCLACAVCGAENIHADAESKDFIVKFAGFTLPNLENLPRFEFLCTQIETALGNIERNASAKMVFTDISVSAAKIFRQK